MLVPFIAISQDYDFTSKSVSEIDIDMAIEMIDTDEIFNSEGVRYLGNGIYTSTAISEYYWSREDIQSSAFSNLRNYIFKWSNCLSATTDDERYTFRKFKQNGKTYGAATSVARVVIGWSSANDFPILNRDECVRRAKENKELLEMGLITQSKYDKDLKWIKRILDCI